MSVDIMAFDDDLTIMAHAVSSTLNIFNEAVVRDGKMVMTYGDDEFLSLSVTQSHECATMCYLRLRTRDMEAEWENVPLGFASTDDCKSILSTIKRAAHVSLKRNSVWYIDRQIKDIVGDRVLMTELTSNKGYLYKVEFTNGFVTYLSIVRDDREYYRPHDLSKLYFIANKNKEAISHAMTADECIVMLANVAMQTDRRVAEFVSVAEQCGGRTMVAESYRTEGVSFDGAKAMFGNGYALKLRIENEEMVVDLFGIAGSQTYILDVRRFKNMTDVYEAVKSFAALPQYVPATANS